MTAKLTIREKAEKLALPVAERLGLSIWETEYVKEGAAYFLRFYIDKPGGVTLDDCEAFSREIDPMLDEENFIDTAYCLEVSSPGTERRLSRPQHFDESIGKKLQIRLIRPESGVRELTGTLAGFSEGIITVESADGVREMPLASCAWVRLCDEDEF